MIEVGKNIYCNWDWGQTKSNRRVSALLFGYCGVGKSRLMNNLCDAKQKVGVARKTITQQVYNKYVKLPQDCFFSLYDSPGIHKNDIRGSNILKRSLRFLQWNVILVQAKLEARFQDSTLTQLAKITRIFSSEQSKKVIYLVSHGDILDQQNDKNKTLKDFKNSLDSHFTNKKVILFSNENSDFEKLAKILYSCAIQFKPTTIDIEDKKFCRPLGYQINKDTLEDQLRKWQNIIKSQPQHKRANIMEDLKKNSPQTYQTLKFRFHQIDSKLPERPKKPTEDHYKEQYTQKIFSNNSKQIINNSLMNSYLHGTKEKELSNLANNKYQKVEQNTHQTHQYHDTRYIPLNRAQSPSKLNLVTNSHNNPNNSYFNQFFSTFKKQFPSDFNGKKTFNTGRIFN